MPKQPNYSKPCVGDRIGDWTILESPNTLRHRILCRCQCGYERRVIFGTLVRGQSSKCLACANKTRNIKHGGAHRIHGKKSRLYEVWSKMKDRCTRENDKRFSRYGGRGISVCEEWASSFEVFQDWALSNGYTEELTIDRINNDGNYTPSNCRWATLKEQARNTSRNNIIQAFGEAKSIVEWSEDPRCSVSQNTLKLRMRYGFPAELSILTPSNEGVFSASSRTKRWHDNKADAKNKGGL